jgi:hypothetical protein
VSSFQFLPPKIAGLKPFPLDGDFNAAMDLGEIERPPLIDAGSLR